jgi:hypothetical protein
MGSTKHERTFVDYDKPYETNIVGLRGIIYFGIGLFLLIVVTFGLMWFLMNVMEEQAKERDAQKVNPMLENVGKEDRLPPEPRLQAAPGFVVGEGKDRVNLELAAPQSEYWELEKRWKKMWEEGERDPATGAVVTLPIEEAKQRLLQQGMKVRGDQSGMKAVEESRTQASYTSSGRMNTERRR